MVEHTFDNDSDDYREPGPFTWQYIDTDATIHPPAAKEHDTERAHHASSSLISARVDGSFRRTDPTQPSSMLQALHCVIDHSVDATVDLRVFMFGGRSDPSTAASCHNHFLVGRFDRTFNANTTTDSSLITTRPHAPFHAVVPSPAVSASSIAAKANIHSSSSSVHRGATTYTSHVYDGVVPSRRYGHSSTMVAGGQVMLIAGGINEKGMTLRDVHYFVPGIAQHDQGLMQRRGHRRERVLVEGAWLKTAGCPATLVNLPQPAHHHRVIVLPTAQSQATPQSSHTFVESWLLIADGRNLFRLDVRVHVPPPVLTSPEDDDDDADEPVMPPPSALVWFEPLSPAWIPLLAGGVAASVPFRHSSLVALLNHDELLVHGGTRCLSHLVDHRDAQKKLLHRSRHRAVSAVGEVSDTAFVYTFSTNTWSYEAAVTEALGHATSHMAIRLDDGRPPWKNEQGFTWHMAVLGVTSALPDQNESHSEMSCSRPWIPPTLSCTGQGLAATLSPEMLLLLASRLCSGVVRRVGVAVGDITFAQELPGGMANADASTSLPHCPPMELSTTLGTSTTTAPSVIFSTSAAAFSPARRLSCTSVATSRRLSATGSAGGRRQSEATSLGAAWTSPTVMIRDTLLEREDVNQQEHLKQLVREALIEVLRGALGNDLLQHYYHKWRRAAAGGAVAAATEAASAGSGSSAAQSLAINARANKELQRAQGAAADLRMCAQCRSVPAEMILHPCGHFVLCSLCCNTTSDCPECGAEFESSSYGCSGNKFPFLHRFLTEQVDAQQLDKREREEYRRMYLIRREQQMTPPPTSSKLRVDCGDGINSTTPAIDEGHATNRSGRMTPPALRTSGDAQHAQLFSSLVTELPSAIKAIHDDDDDGALGNVDDVSEQFKTPARSEGYRSSALNGRRPPTAEVQAQQRREIVSAFVSGQPTSPVPRRSLRVPHTLMM